MANPNRIYCPDFPHIVRKNSMRAKYNGQRPTLKIN